VKKLIAFLAVIVILGYGASRAYDWVNYQVDTPVSGASHAVSFKVSQGEGTDAIADDLHAKGLIRDPSVFRYYLRYTGQGGSIQAGDYVLNTNMSLRQIAEALQHGRAEQVAVTLPEGYPYKMMADAVQQSGIATAADYIAAVKDPGWGAQYDFLAGRPKGADLEGFLFPNTYSLDKGATAKDLVKTQLDEFGKQFTPEMRGAIAQPSGARPAESVFNIVILASMVEREVNQPQDRAKVCGLYYNRLKIGMPLQVDATILYAEGAWKKSVTFDDLKIASPYNTYTNPGLPPGPIANPGTDALKACVNPDDNNYLYYFSDSKGVTHFESNFDQFRQDQAKYGVYGQ
jgi:peptidoglycan lytic transglycosylase G